MNLYNIPYLNNKKGALAGWGLLLLGISKVLIHVANLLMGNLNLLTFMQGLPSLYDNLIVGFVGLGVLGIRHAIEKNGTKIKNPDDPVNHTKATVGNSL